MGFAEFTSTLISETLNAIVAATLRQEKQVAELEQQALLTPDAYAKENLTEDIVRKELLRLFPSIDASKSSVDVGETYSNTKEKEEFPAIFAKIGYHVTKADITISEGKATINNAGYTRIFLATQKALALQQLAVIKAVIARGIPRVLVDNGRISSKLTLSFQTSTTISTVTSTAGKISGAGLRKIIATPVSANKPEYLTLKADVLSEIEITFKTVTP